MTLRQTLPEENKMDNEQSTMVEKQRDPKTKPVQRPEKEKPPKTKPPDKQPEKPK